MASEVIRRAAALPTSATPTRLQSRSSESMWGSGTFEADFALGPFTAHEHGTYYRISYPSQVEVSLTGSCDDARFEHDMYMSGLLEVRHDPEDDTWFIATVQASQPTVVTALRIVRTGEHRLTARPSAWGALAAAAALAVAAWASRRASRHRARQAWVEATLGATGIATSSDGSRALVVGAAPGQRSVLYEPLASANRSYRASALPRASHHLFSTRLRERSAERSFARVAVSAYLACVILASLVAARP